MHTAPCVRSQGPSETKLRSARLGVPTWAAALILITLGTTTLHAQELVWDRTFGGSGQDGAQAMEPTSDGGIIISGFTSYSPYAYTDVYLIKTNAAGSPTWTRTFGGPMNDYGSCVRELHDGGYVIAGRYEENAQTFDAYLIRTNASGDLVWQRRYNLGDDERAHSVCLTADGGFLLAGQAWVINGSFGSYDMWLVKTDANGNLKWQRTYAYASEGNDVALSVEPTNDGGFIVGGFTQSTVWDAYVIRIDAVGNPIWARTCDLGFSSECYSVEPLEDGTFVITGIGTPGGDGDVLLVKLAANGDVLWHRTHGGTQDDQGQSVRKMADGGFVVTGMTGSFGAGQWDVYVLRTDP